MGIFLNIFMVDLWEIFFFDFLDPIKQAPALKKNHSAFSPEILAYRHLRPKSSRSGHSKIKQVKVQCYETPEIRSPIQRRKYLSTFDL